MPGRETLRERASSSGLTRSRPSPTPGAGAVVSVVGRLAVEWPPSVKRSSTVPKVSASPCARRFSITRSPLTRVPLVLSASLTVTPYLSTASSACAPETEASTICSVRPGLRPTERPLSGIGIDSPLRSPFSKRRE